MNKFTTGLGDKSLPPPLWRPPGDAVLSPSAWSEWRETYEPIPFLKPLHSAFRLQFE